MYYYYRHYYDVVKVVCGCVQYCYYRCSDVRVVAFLNMVWEAEGEHEEEKRRRWKRGVGGSSRNSGTTGVIAAEEQRPVGARGSNG